MSDPSASAILETGRLRLRTWSATDLPALVRLNTDPEGMRYFPGIPTAEESRAFLERQIANQTASGMCLWVVEVKADGRFIGFTGMQHPRFEAEFTPCVEIGWHLDRSVWGQGYAPEAAGACLDYAWSALGLEEVVAFTVPDNRPSRRVMEKIGMCEAGAFDHPGLPVGHPLRPHVLYRVRRSGPGGAG